MANEFKHKDPGSTLTQAEYITTDGTGHIFDCQATGDILYASSATVLKNLGKGAANTILSMGGSCIPAWTASPSVTDLTIGGGCITLSAATDIDLLDNNASALSFDATGKTGIIDIVTTDCSEGVTMSGTLGVTGVLTATGGLAGGAIDIGASTITTTGLISGGSLDIDNVLINGTTIGHTCDTDLLTLGNATLLAKGTVTVGVCGTGHDVKFFGCEAGAYMLYDESEEQLEIRGAAADAATSTGKLLLSTALTNINACDVIGSINFQAPLEAGDCDSRLVAAGIRAVAQATFTCAVNATDLIFYTGHSEAATEKFRFTSQNEIGIAGANYGTDGQVLTSGGAGAAAAWENAAGGCLSCDCSPQLGGSLDAQNETILNVGAAGNDWTANSLLMSNSNGGATNLIRVHNTQNSTDSNAQVGARVTNTASDAYFAWLGGSANWVAGVDGSVTDVFKLANGTLPGTNDAIRITAASPPVITYNTTHPTGTFDFVCESCGRHSHEEFICCGIVSWHDDVLAMRKASIDLSTAINPYAPGQSLNIEHLVKLGVMEYDTPESNSGDVPWLGMNIKAAQWYTWAGMWQTRSLVDGNHACHETRIKELEAKLGGCSSG